MTINYGKPHTNSEDVDSQHALLLVNPIVIKNWAKPQTCAECTNWAGACKKYPKKLRFAFDSSCEDST